MLNALTQAGVFAVVRQGTVVEALEVGERLVAGGISILEVSFTLSGAADAIARMHRDLPRAVLGAGTVLSADDARRAIDAGATFLVSPDFSDEVAAVARAAGVDYFPGAFTPTEVVRCWRGGATAVKVFPAAVVGPAMFRQLREPLPDVPLVAVGGVSLASAPEYLAAGAVAVGIGGSLAALASSDVSAALGEFQAARETMSVPTAPRREPAR